MQRSNSEPIPLPLFTANTPIARHCKIVEVEQAETNNGFEVKWDESILRNCLSKAELADTLFLKNITHGHIITGKLWPLLFDSDCNAESLVYYRSIPFFKKVVEDPSIIRGLAGDQLISFMVGVRDLWLAKSWNVLTSDEDKQLLNDVLNLIDDDVFPAAEIQFVPFSLVPTKNKRILRFIEHLEEIEGFDGLGSAAQIGIQINYYNAGGRDENYESDDSIKHDEEKGDGDEKREDNKIANDKREKNSENENGEKNETNANSSERGQTNDNNTESGSNLVVYAVWVDARDLSYHNFECIMPLDRLLRRYVIDNEDPKQPLDLKIKTMKKLNDDMEVYTGYIDGADAGMLLKFDELDLYQQPSNASTRGGERFIFSSQILSNSLTSAIWNSGISRNMLICLKSFKMVNSVFRCNRFSPGDNKFKLHMDTPYYDAALHHISKYTIIIYLTAGEGKPALRIGGGEDGTTGPTVSIDNFEAMQCVIFSQQYEHEGNAFLNTRKVFLRSELIFEVQKTDHVPEVGGLFSSATYFTVQSTFQPELAQHAHDLYERVNRAHWGKQPIESVVPQLLYKCWEDKVHFVTNGNDYFFPYAGNSNSNSPQLTLKICALVAVLDHFNCKIDSANAEPRKKRARTQSYTVLQGSGNSNPNGKVEESVDNTAIAEKKQGKEHMKRGDFVNAFLSFYAALGRSNKCTDLVKKKLQCSINYNMAVMHLKQGKNDRAFAELSTVVSVAPNYKDAHKKLTDMWWRNGAVQRSVTKMNANVLDSKASVPTNGKSFFRKACVTKTIDPPPSAANTTKWALEYLWDIIDKQYSDGHEPVVNIFTQEDKRNFLEEELQEPESNFMLVCDPEYISETEYEWDEETINSPCCSFHHQNFKPHKCKRTKKLMKRAIQYASERLMKAPLMLMGEEIYLDPEMILIEDDKIYINSAANGEPLKVNFAACWNGHAPSDYIWTKENIDAPQLLIPPIPFVAIPAENNQGAGFRLMLDFFHNDWVQPEAKLACPFPIPVYAGDTANGSDTFDHESYSLFEQLAVKYKVPSYVLE